MAYSKHFKLRCIKHFETGLSNISDVATIKGIPKQTLARWIRNYYQFGESGIDNKNPGATQTKIDPIIELKIINEWKRRNMSAHKLFLKMEQKGIMISERQIQKTLNKNGLKISGRKRPSQIKFVKYEWPRPNMLWHTDWTVCPFTGFQLIAFLDDHSRLIIHAEYFPNATTANTIKSFKKAIKKHGPPQNILTDNGTQFTPARSQKGPFTTFCEENNIKHILGRVHHPQTNGKIERWFGTYKQEFKAGEDTLKTFVNFYNNERLHQGIYYKTPLERYESNINAV